MKKKFRLILIIAICFTVFISAVLGALFIGGNMLVRTDYSLQSDKLDGLVIAHLSDIHCSVRGENNKQILDLVQETEPHLIMVTGDTVDEIRGRHADMVTLLEDLARIAPVVCILGNHETHYPRLDVFLQDVEAVSNKNHKIYMLIDEFVSFDTPAGKVTILGNGAHSSNRTATLEQLRDSDGYRILLNHYPEDFCLRMQYHQYCDLMLAGHAHGGQWRIPGTDISLYSPGEGFFPKYTAGVHTVDDSHMVISRGIGTWAPRLFNPPEVIAITVE